nr:hypothetical protein HK105_000218 [Polyrhizophydium stewartii]
MDRLVPPAAATDDPDDAGTAAAGAATAVAATASAAADDDAHVKRGGRFNIKLPLSMRTKFEAPFDRYLWSLLVETAHLAALPDMTAHEQRIRAVSGSIKSRWTLWVSRHVRDVFYERKQALAPSLTHGQFVEALLILKDLESLFKMRDSPLTDTELPLAHELTTQESAQPRRPSNTRSQSMPVDFDSVSVSSLASLDPQMLRLLAIKHLEQGQESFPRHVRRGPNRHGSLDFTSFVE